MRHSHVTMRNPPAGNMTVLSNTADYALRAILALARLGGARPLRADEIADATGAPRNYTAKTLNALAKAGILTSSRGPLGGFSLAVAPERLAVAHIVDVFDAPRRVPHCLMGTGRCDPSNPCATHHKWSAVQAACRSPLLDTTVGELLGQHPAPRLEIAS
jgi:Rrf2 family protein